MADQNTAPKQNAVVKAAPQSVDHILMGNDSISLVNARGGGYKLIKVAVALNVADKTLVAPYGMGRKDQQGRWIPTYLCTAEGYKLQAAASGLQTFMADTVIVDGKEQPNPYLIRDEKGAIAIIYCRAVTKGKTAMNRMVHSDRTAVFDLRLYKLVDLLAKAKRVPGAFKILPSDATKPGPSWVGYPLDEYATLYCDTSSPDFVEWMSTMINRARKATEIAQTFAVRNSIKHHPNVRFHTVEGVASATATCWCAPDDEADRKGMTYEAEVKTIEAEIKAGGSEVITGTDAVHEDTAAVEADERADADEHAPAEEEETAAPGTAGGPTGPTGPEGKPDPTDALIAQINELSSSLPAKEFGTALSKAGVRIDEGEDWRLADSATLVTINRLLSDHVNAKAVERGTKKGGRA